MQSCERIFVPNWLFFAIRVICVSQQFVCIFVDSILLLFFIRFLFVCCCCCCFCIWFNFFSLLSWCLRCAHFCATFVPLFFFLRLVCEVDMLYIFYSPLHPSPDVVFLLIFFSLLCVASNVVNIRIKWQTSTKLEAVKGITCVLHCLYRSRSRFHSKLRANSTAFVHRGGMANKGCQIKSSAREMRKDWLHVVSWNTRVAHIK